MVIASAPARLSFTKKHDRIIFKIKQFSLKRIQGLSEAARGNRTELFFGFVSEKMEEK
jgi:hypothetical protein